MIRRRLLTIVGTGIIASALAGGATAAAPENPGCVGQAVSRAGTNGYRAPEVNGWHETSRQVGMAPGQWGVQWIHNHCGLPAGKASK
jgi:hypothetical protein